MQPPDLETLYGHTGSDTETRQQEEAGSCQGNPSNRIVEPVKILQGDVHSNFSRRCSVSPSSHDNAELLSAVACGWTAAGKST
jgi:hypothetical protein